MKQVINIIAVDTASPGSAEQKKADLAAAIDLDIFEADGANPEGERFWESFWRTQLVYGGISEGQALDKVFQTLDSTIFEKLHQDLTSLRDRPTELDEAETNDILGMMVFLLCIERADPQYDPIEQDGYEASLSHFTALVTDEHRRRAATAA